MAAHNTSAPWEIHCARPIHQRKPEVAPPVEDVNELTTKVAGVRVNRVVAPVRVGL